MQSYPREELRRTFPEQEQLRRPVELNETLDEPNRYSRLYHRTPQDVRNTGEVGDEVEASEHEEAVFIPPYSLRSCLNVDLQHIRQQVPPAHESAQRLMRKLGDIGRHWPLQPKPTLCFGAPTTATRPPLARPPRSHFPRPCSAEEPRKTKRAAANSGRLTPSIEAIRPRRCVTRSACRVRDVHPTRPWALHRWLLPPIRPEASLHINIVDRLALEDLRLMGAECLHQHLKRLPTAVLCSSTSGARIPTSRNLQAIGIHDYAMCTIACLRPLPCPPARSASTRSNRRAARHAISELTADATGP